MTESTWPTASPAPNPELAERRRRINKIVLPVSAILIGGLIVIAIAGGSASTGTKAGSPDMAFEMCKTFVERQLKAPSTATFRNYYENDGEVNVTGDGDGPYTVVSTVDAENSFGAKIRNSFVCTVTHESGTDTWDLNDISVN